MVGRAPQQGQGIGMPDFVWLRGLSGGNNRQSQSVAALAGGAQAGATPIGVANAQGVEAQLVEIATVASAADSCQLPQAVKDKVLDVINTSANSANVYANPTPNRSNSLALDTINGATNVTAYAVAPNVPVRFFCPRNGIWAALKSA